MLYFTFCLQLIWQTWCNRKEILFTLFNSTLLDFTWLYLTLLEYTRYDSLHFLSLSAAARNFSVSGNLYSVFAVLYFTLLYHTFLYTTHFTLLTWNSQQPRDRSLLQNIVSFIWLFCKRDISFEGHTIYCTYVRLSAATRNFSVSENSYSTLATCVTWLFLICVTWLTHMCDMTHPFVWHDSSICVNDFLICVT